jgi:hypothetical protein
MVTCFHVIYVLAALSNQGHWNLGFDGGHGGYHEDAAACERAAKDANNRPHGEAKCVSFKILTEVPRDDPHISQFDGCLKAGSRRRN